MSKEAWPDRLVVRAPGAVHLLTDLRAIRYLAPFLRRPHTLSSAAEAVEKPTSTVAYWIPKFVREGLVVELSPTARAGMAMRRYRACARQLVVPLDAMPLDRRVALLDEGRHRTLRRFLDGLDEAMVEADLGGLVFQAHGEDAPTGISITVDDEPRTPRIYDSWLLASLTPEQAEQLAGELEALVAKYANGSRGRPHIFHLGFAPEPRHRWRSATD
jgi:hypothetical protein